MTCCSSWLACPRTCRSATSYRAVRSDVVDSLGCLDWHRCSWGLGLGHILQGIMDLLWLLCLWQESTLM
jgi:hypothetical protein